MFFIARKLLLTIIVIIVIFTAIASALSKSYFVLLILLISPLFIDRACRENHMEFCTIRRAKFSTIMMLHLLQQEGDFECNDCGCRIGPVDVRYHCTSSECPDFDQCEKCHKSTPHPHQMEQLGFSLMGGTMGGDSKLSDAEKRQMTMLRCLEALVHASSCKNLACDVGGCKQIKQLMVHSQSCMIRSPICGICKQLSALCMFHARGCRVPLGQCPVLQCDTWRQRILQQRKQHAMAERQLLARRIAVQIQHGHTHGHPAAIPGGEGLGAQQGNLTHPVQVVGPIAGPSTTGAGMSVSTSSGVVVAPSHLAVYGSIGNAKAVDMSAGGGNSIPMGIGAGTSGVGNPTFSAEQQKQIIQHISPVRRQEMQQVAHELMISMNQLKNVQQQLQAMSEEQRQRSELRNHYAKLLQYINQLKNKRHAIMNSIQQELSAKGINWPPPGSAGNSNGNLGLAPNTAPMAAQQSGKMTMRNSAQEAGVGVNGGSAINLVGNGGAGGVSNGGSFGTNQQLPAMARPTFPLPSGSASFVGQPNVGPSINPQQVQGIMSSHAQQHIASQVVQKQQQQQQQQMLLNQQGSTLQHGMVGAMLPQGTVNIGANNGLAGASGISQVPVVGSALKQNPYPGVAPEKFREDLIKFAQELKQYTSGDQFKSFNESLTPYRRVLLSALKRQQEQVKLRQQQQLMMQSGQQASQLAVGPQQQQYAGDQSGIVSMQMLAQSNQPGQQQGLAQMASPGLQVVQQQQQQLQHYKAPTPQMQQYTQQMGIVPQQQSQQQQQGSYPAGPSPLQGNITASLTSQQNQSATFPLLQTPFSPSPYLPSSSQTSSQGISQPQQPSLPQPTLPPFQNEPSASMPLVHDSAGNGMTITASSDVSFLV